MTGLRMLRAGRRRVASRSVDNADAGLHLAATLSAGVDDRSIVHRMEQRGLLATPLSSCYASSRSRSGLLLGFGGATEARLVRGARLLGDILRESADTGVRSSG